MAEVAVFHLLSNFATYLGTYLKEEAKLLTGVGKEIEYIRAEFKQMKIFLRAADAMEEGNPELDVWVKQVREAAYDTVDALDMYMLRLGHHHGPGFRGFLCKVSCFIKTLKARHQIASEVKEIKSRFVDISVGYQRYNDIYRSSSTHSGIAWNDCRGDALLLKEADLVGIDKPKSQLLQWLVDEDPQLKVISVAGMGGLGKTTLTKMVYDDATVKRHFQTHVWITVSETVKVEELLKDMIRQLFEEVRQPLPQSMDNMDTNGLKRTINDFLQQKRYVFVLDDVWHIPKWQFRKIIFPECNCGSRIVLTTRNNDLASFASKEYHGSVYNLQPLPHQQSWDLFCKKAFQGNPCPSHLEDLSRDILKRCEGLPLAIVAIGGLLSTKENSLDEWERIYRCLGEELQSSDKLVSMKKILSLSYFDLPYYLKLCFLYLSIFPEDFFISHMRLIRLWVAEGFVEAKERMTKEEVAEGYVNELINRNLVQVAKRRHRSKSYRIHDFWREIVVSKSREQNFVSLASAEKVRRLSLHTNLDDIQINCFTRLRSLLVFSKEDPLSMLSKVVSLGKRARLLTVLDLRGTDLKTFPKEIVKLVHLTYLSLRETEVKLIPKSIGNLKKLETLDLKLTLVTELPEEILKLQYLRHLLLSSGKELIDGYFGFHRVSGFKALKGIGSLTSLQKLCYIEADNGSNNSTVLSELGKLTQLRKLNILRLPQEHGKVLCSSLEKLNSLQSLFVGAKEEDEIIDLDSLSSAPRRLRTLYLIGRMQNLPHWIQSLHNLTRVFLGWSKLRDVDPLQSFQDLPNLVYLHLKVAYEGEGLCFKAGGFRTLRFLWLARMGGLKWVRVEAGSMPLLEVARLSDCKSMKKLPSGIEHLTNLKFLDLGDLSDSLILGLDRDFKGGDYWKIAHIPDVHIWYSKLSYWKRSYIYKMVESRRDANL
ncbi:disease resistance protein RPM1-like [Rhododendron vialii]|uniref:disease resistance protein RPM1-like n=1 Tax=Rhododendron vialii TaxID=182163 RepID=UPI00265DBA98|nr:disease resistance protein RPM1-like [Rhododendron vialii]